jgi:hypothetical protein
MQKSRTRPVRPLVVVEVQKEHAGGLELGPGLVPLPEFRQGPSQRHPHGGFEGRHVAGAQQARRHLVVGRRLRPVAGFRATVAELDVDAGQRDRRQFGVDADAGRGQQRREPQPHIHGLAGAAEPVQAVAQPGQGLRVCLLVAGL